jgi:hypothetical protein
LTYKTSPIGRSELATVLKKSKRRKASGIDAINHGRHHDGIRKEKPVTILKND